MFFRLNPGTWFMPDLDQNHPNQNHLGIPLELTFMAHTSLLSVNQATYIYIIFRYITAPTVDYDDIKTLYQLQEGNNRGRPK
jgi:hypothetical protein